MNWGELVMSFVMCATLESRHRSFAMNLVEPRASQNRTKDGTSGSQHTVLLRESCEAARAPTGSSVHFEWLVFSSAGEKK